MFRNIGLFISATLASVFCTAAIMTALSLPGALLPFVLVILFGLCLFAFRGLDCVNDSAKLTSWEWALLVYAIIISVITLIPYSYEYIGHRLVAAVDGDDYEHFQTLASLVNTGHFPPRLNFRPEIYLHFYYIPWIPAAALSDVLKFFTGKPFIKLTYGLDTLFLNIISTLILILFLRHALERRARKFAVLAVLLAGAIPVGAYAIWNWLQGNPIHSEWWQWETAIHLRNQFSIWTTLLVWVPHHLISAMALLLTVVIATEPMTLMPRKSVRAHILAGLLVGFSLFSSIFSFLGGAVCLLPFAARYRQKPKLVIALLTTAFVVSIPLVYLYLGATSADGFIFFDAFNRYYERFHTFWSGVAGLAVAAVCMIIAIGWIALLSFPFARKSPDRSGLWPLAVASSLYLLSTVFISFTGWNNYAMRGFIVPMIILSSFWAQTLASRRTGAHFFSDAKGWRARLAKFGFIGVLALAGAAQINEFMLHVNWSRDALQYSWETKSCKQHILDVNDMDSLSVDFAEIAKCNDYHAVYGIERQFAKPALWERDMELTGGAP